MLRNLVRYSVSGVTTLFMFLLLILAGRQLGAEDFGRFTFAIALAFLFDPIMDPGIYHYLIREMARDRQATHRLVAHALSWKLLAMFPAFVLIALTANVIHDSAATLWAVYLMAVSAFLKSYKDVLRCVLLSSESFGMDALSLTIERGSLLLFAALVLLLDQGLIALCLVFVTVRLIDLFIIIFFVRRRGVTVRVGTDVAFLKNMILAAIPVGALYITLNVYNYVDTVMLSVFRQEAEVGWYGASYRIYEGLLIFPGIISTVFMPRLSRLFKQDETVFRTLVGDGIKYVFLIAVIVALNGVVLSEFVVPLFFGEEFAASIASMRLLLLGVPFAFCLNFLQMAMISMDRQKVVFQTTAIGLVLNVLLNLLLIPSIGYRGAALSTVIVEALLLVGLLGYLSRTGVKLETWRLFGMPSLAAAVSCIPAVVLLASQWVLTLIVFNATFATMLFLLKVLGEREIGAALSLVRRPPPQIVSLH
jgi:O-antigen/teichoic acid export membrane protein